MLRALPRAHRPHSAVLLLLYLLLLSAPGFSPSAWSLKRTCSLDSGLPTSLYILRSEVTHAQDLTVTSSRTLPSPSPTRGLQTAACMDVLRV